MDIRAAAAEPSNAPLAGGIGSRTIMLLAVALVGAVVAALMAAYGPSAFAVKLMKFTASRWDAVISPYAGVYLGGIGIVLVVEVFVLGYRQSSIYRLLHPTQSTWMDVFCFAIDFLKVAGVFMTIFSLGLADVALKAIGRVTPQGVLVLENPILQTVVIFVVIDFLKYWMHYFQHIWGFWWEAHKFHHAATEFNVITTTRGHPLDSAMRIVFLAVPTALLGGTGDQFLFLSLLLSMHSGLTHSMINWDFGWVGRWVLMSPVTHRIHHSDMPEHFEKNMGSVFIIWDRLFGTYYDGQTVNPTVNVSDNFYNHKGLLYDLLACPWAVLRTIGRLPRRLLARQALPPAE
ncbi:MAG: hypothetical protein BGP12_20195 [Rhodospirillales bacterium 70-18]|nr:sterol desaturase family protein [Rhodospirillales bacterium]OJY74328.1 MAG: hypothetical protein BGP12_20195 [Rhodospirillales bacterium 70-18]